MGYKNRVDVGVLRRVDSPLAAKVRDAVAQDRVGQQPSPVEIDEDGAVSEPGQVCGRTLSTSRSHGSARRHSAAVAVDLMPEVGEPPAHLEVHRLGTDYGLLRKRPVPRYEHERVRLRSAQTSVRADEFLKGSHLSGLRPVGAVHHDIGAIRETVSAFDVPGRIRTEGRKRVLSFHAIFVEKVEALLADDDRPALLGASEQETDARMIPQRGDEVRVALVDPFYRDPPGLPREGDEPEAAGGHDDELRWCFPVFITPYLLPFLLAYDDGSVDRPPLRRQPHRPGEGVVATGRLRQRRAQVPYGFVALGRGLDALGGAGLLYELLHRRPRPDQGIGKAAVNARLDIPATLLRRTPPLAYHLAHKHDERACDVIGICEVGEVILADPARAIAPQHRAHRQKAVRRIT